MAMWSFAKKLFLTIKNADLTKNSGSAFYVTQEKHRSSAGGSFSPQEIVSN